MRTILPTVVLMALLPGALRAEAPSVDQVLAKHIAARGGYARIKAIQSVKSTGRLELGPMVLSISIENPRGSFRSDTSYQGLTKIEVFDGTQGWVLDPFAGDGPAAKAQPMTPAQLKQAALQMDFDSPLVDAPAKGHRISLEGKARVGSAEAYVVRVDLATGNVLRSYLDTTTFMEIKVTNMAVNEGQEIEVEALLSDYRPVAGVMLPFVLEIRPKGQPQGMKMTFDKVEANLPMEPARFKMPH
jgi:hypothetical protein